MPEAQASTRLRWAVVLAAAVLLLAGLGQLGASAPDEPRYLQVAEEMRSLQHGPSGLVLLHLNGAVYDQKPPLYYWLAGLLGSPLGKVTEAAARLPSALAGVFLVWLTLQLGTRLFGGAVGVLGAALLLSVFEFAHLARRVQLDILLAALETMALVGFWWLDRDLMARSRAVALFHCAMGLAVLTKGPVGFLIPTLVVIGYLAWEGRLRGLRRAFPLWGLALSLGPGIAWVTAAAALAPAGFADDALGTNVVGRFFVGTSHQRPLYYYLYQLPLDFLPWTTLWPLAYLGARRHVFAGPERDPESHRAWRFLLSWLGMSLLFFSLSSGKRGLYLVPAFPALALMCADGAVRRLQGRAALPGPLTVCAALFALLAAVVGAEALLASAGSPLILGEDFVAAIRVPFLAAFGSALIGVACAATAAWVVLTRNRAPLRSFAGVAIAGAVVIELAVFLLLYPALDPIRSHRPIGIAAGRLTQPSDRIGLLSDRAMAGGLAYYGERRVSQLSTPESVRQFIHEGGKVIVVKRRKLDRVEEVTPVSIRDSFRTGRREIVVVTPRSGSTEDTR